MADRSRFLCDQEPVSSGFVAPDARKPDDQIFRCPECAYLLGSPYKRMRASRMAGN